MLASHSSGLQREIPCYVKTDSPLCNETIVLERLANLYLVYPPYTRSHYSNLGISLLGRALERAVGIEYEQFVETNILPVIGMTSSGFNYTQDIIDRRAIGVIPIPGGRVEAPFVGCGWGNPMGGLYSTARDMSTYMSFLFRNNGTGSMPSDGVLIDGVSMREFMTPAMNLPDGNAAFGYPWEFNYTRISTGNSSGFWIKSKAGAASGYRSQIAMATDIKLGVFFVSMSSQIDDPTQSIFTFPGINILLPYFVEVLWPKQTSYELPLNSELFIGYYNCGPGPSPLYNVGWVVFESGGVLYGSWYWIKANETSEMLVLEDERNVMDSYVGLSTYYGFNPIPIAETADLTTIRPVVNMTAVDFDSNMLQMHLTEPEMCRWLDDGMDSEYFYCNPDPSMTFCQSIHLTLHTCTFLSKP
eukprot:TRINITY_DN1329_c0_g1_i2.p1 TRINITY_DN1329_c0_g1~~TRINITY_DN1329_c0_g1_i2.p1  ORF type:complete len:415 (+),score=57.04 TRINITY_DN1329_c0_g1_i2:106-1350(+)